MLRGRGLGWGRSEVDAVAQGIIDPVVLGAEALWCGAEGAGAAGFGGLCYLQVAGI